MIMRNMFFPMVLICTCAAADQQTPAKAPSAKSAPAIHELVLQGRIPEAVRLASKSPVRANEALRRLLDLVDTQITDRQISQALETMKSAGAFAGGYARASGGKTLLPEALKVRELRLEGIRLNDAKEYAKAEPVLRQALDISVKIKDARLEGGIHNNLGIALQFQDKLESAVREFESARQIAEGQSDALRAGSYNFNLGRAEYQFGQLNPALQAFKRSMEQYQSASKTNFQALATENVGMVQSKLDSISPEALKYLELALKLFERLGDKRSMARCYFRMGDHLAYSQKFSEAAAYGEQAVPLLTEAGDNTTLQAVYSFLGDMYARSGDADKSERYKKLADDIDKKQPDSKK